MLRKNIVSVQKNIVSVPKNIVSVQKNIVSVQKNIVSVQKILLVFVGARGAGTRRAKILVEIDEFDGLFFFQSREEQNF